MEASEDLYCAEQISIPPTFPYLLRQYAKDAIRTQPLDLLKWSTTYFRCLSLNCPPPVKVRLEYPIPDDWNGLTPGWVKSLYLQIHPNSTVDFKVLWDRWVGSCLQHERLIQILCLGGFKDPHAVPWLKFIGLCVAMISKSLTLTMIRVCEILTEEPEGASAMITLEQFLSIYKFLAGIDASLGQWMKNLYFPDTLLGLWKEKREKFEEAVQWEESEEEGEICSDHVVSETVEGRVAEVAELTKEVSCPSIKDDDYEKIEDYLDAQEKLAEAEDEGDDEVTEYDEEGKPKPKSPRQDFDILSHDGSLEFDKKRHEEYKTEERQALADMTERELAQHEAEKKQLKKLESAPKEPDFEEKGLLEDLARLKALQMEMRGEDDNALEDYKQELMKQLERTPSEIEAMSHFASKLQDQEEKVLLVIHREDSESKVGESVDEVTTSLEEEDEKKYEEIYVDAVPGIGSKVSEDLVKEVERYMREMAKIQHGMVMPRNIRHYDCPPLEEETQQLVKEIKKMDDAKRVVVNI